MRVPCAPALRKDSMAAPWFRDLGYGVSTSEASKHGLNVCQINHLACVGFAASQPALMAVVVFGLADLVGNLANDIVGWLWQVTVAMTPCAVLFHLCLYCSADATPTMADAGRTWCCHP